MIFLIKKNIYMYIYRLIYNKKLSGPIPESIGNLTKLTEL